MTTEPGVRDDSASRERTETISAFVLDVPRTDLDDLRDRLLRTRWPDRETVADTTQGPRLEKVQRLVAHWSTAYDWRRVEALLTAGVSSRPASTGSTSTSSTSGPASPARVRCC